MYCFKLIVLLFVQNAIKPTSYLFVRIPNLLCMLKYGNVEMEVPAGTDHFADRVWESAKPETGAHLPPAPGRQSGRRRLARIRPPARSDTFTHGKEPALLRL